MAHLREEVNQLFAQSIAQPLRDPVAAQTWSPAVDIYETDEVIGLSIEAPGMKAEDIDIQISDDTLTIRGERNIRQDESRQFVRIERNYGTFQRSFTLGVLVDQHKVRATYTDGVLEIILQKRENPKPKQIKIEVRTTPDAKEIEA
jgi:HSP20 family protein